MTKWHRGSIALIFCLLFSVLAVAADERAYRQGIELFKAGDFSQALTRFQQAEAAGMRSTTLFYNIGATHYRLGNYNESALYFMRIRFDEKWGALAEYNLGLIAEKQNNTVTAERHYREAIRKSEVERVRELAQARLNALSKPASAPQSSWLRYLSLALGYDDNPALVRDSDIPPGTDSDVYIETLGHLSGYLSGNRHRGLRLTAGFYSRNYDDATEFDVTGINAGLYLDTEGDNWRLVRGLTADNYWVDGEQYSSGVNLHLRATRLLEAVSLDMSNETSYIDGGSDFEFISGFRNRLDMAVFRRTSVGSWRIGYLNEFNNRDDFSDGDTFLSYSPVRHSLYGQLLRPLSQDWSARARLEYRHSRYRDRNSEVDPNTGVVAVDRRRDDRFVASLLVRRAIGNKFSVFGEYRYTDNDSDLDRFAYDSHQVILGVDVGF